jgi:hypothetical protein
MLALRTGKFLKEVKIYMKTNEKGISLIVFVVTITSTYDEANKIGRFPPKNKIETIRKLTNIDKVAAFMSAAFILG